MTRTLLRTESPQRQMPLTLLLLLGRQKSRSIACHHQSWHADPGGYPGPHVRLLFTQPDCKHAVICTTLRRCFVCSRFRSLCDRSFARTGMQADRPSLRKPFSVRAGTVYIRPARSDAHLASSATLEALGSVSPAAFLLGNATASQ